MAPDCVASRMMTMTKRRAALPGAAMLFAVASLCAALAAAADEKPAAPEPAAGQLLIASAAIQDPRFYHSVVLLVRHDASGALGIVVNRPLGDKPIADLLADAAGRTGKTGKETEGTPVEGTVRVYLGGPVQPQFGFVIHSADYRRPETVAIADGLAMTATAQVLRDIGHHKGPAKYLFALGYSGWGAGQLEAEMARHDWFTEPAAPDLVFDVERGEVWQKALARRTREL